MGLQNASAVHCLRKPSKLLLTSLNGPLCKRIQRDKINPQINHVEETLNILLVRF